MLEQYIKNFAHGYLGLESEHLDKIEPDEGLYVISINDTLLCTIEELDTLTSPRFSMTVALGNAEHPKTFLEKLSGWFIRLRQTPWNGPARLILAPEAFTAGLQAVIDADSIHEDQQLFNNLLDSFMKCASFVAHDNLNPATAIPPLVKGDCTSDFKNLLKSAGIDENALSENFNRFMISEDFGMVLDYNSLSDYVLITNSFDISISEEKLLELLALNPSLPESLSFNYEQGVVYLQQALNLKNTHDKDFLKALERQEKISNELKHELDSGDNSEPLKMVLNGENSKDFMFV